MRWKRKLHFQNKGVNIWNRKLTLADRKMPLGLFTVRMAVAEKNLLLHSWHPGFIQSVHRGTVHSYTQFMFWPNFHVFKAKLLFFITITSTNFTFFSFSAIIWVIFFLYWTNIWSIVFVIYIQKSQTTKQSNTIRQKSILVSHYVCNLSNLKRRGWSVIVILATLQLWETECGKKIQ